MKLELGKKSKKEAYREGWCDGFIQAWNTQAQNKKEEKKDGK